VPPAPEPAPLSKPQKTKKVTETTYEVLNPQASSSASGPVSPTRLEDNSDDEETGLPEMTPMLEGFSKIPVGSYEESWSYIQDHKGVYVEGASDALVVAAFTAEREGRRKYSKQCVHQSLLLQYCEKLGKDGPRMFFNK